MVYIQKNIRRAKRHARKGIFSVLSVLAIGALIGMSAGFTRPTDAAAFGGITVIGTPVVNPVVNPIVTGITGTGPISLLGTLQVIGSLVNSTITHSTPASSHDDTAAASDSGDSHDSDDSGSSDNGIVVTGSTDSAGGTPDVPAISQSGSPSTPEIVVTGVNLVDDGGDAPTEAAVDTPAPDTGSPCCDISNVTTPPPDTGSPCCSTVAVTTPPTLLDSGSPCCDIVDVTTPPPDSGSPCCSDTTVITPPDTGSPCCSDVVVTTPPDTGSPCCDTTTVTIPPDTGSTCCDVIVPPTPPVTPIIDVPPVPPTPPLTPLATCDSFTGTPNTISPGDAVTLAWQTTNATSISIDQGVGQVTPTDTGSTIVHPTMDTTYTATVTGAANTVVCQASVHVTTTPPPPPPTLASCDALTGTPNTIAPGDAVTLAWHTTNAQSISIDNGVGVVTPTAAGSFIVHPTQDTTYTATVTGAANSVNCATSVHVTNVPPPPVLASCDSFTGTPNEIHAGDAVTLAWQTSNATSISIDQGVGVVTPTAAGSIVVNPTQDTTYTATVTGASNTVTCQASVKIDTVIAPPVTPACVQLTADRYSIDNAGDPVTLSWVTDHASAISIDNGVGTVTPVASGSIVVNPTGATTYTASVPDAPANAQCSVVITLGGTTGGGGGGGGGGSHHHGGGGHPSANVSLDVLARPNAQGLVFLSQIPYTGLDLGPVGTFVYWTVLALWSAAAAYLILFGMLPFAARRVKAFSGSVQNELHHGSQDASAHVMAHASVHAAAHTDAHAPAHEEEHGHDDHHATPPIFGTILKDLRLVKDEPAHAPAVAHSVAAPAEQKVFAPGALDGFRSYASGPALSIDDIVKGLSRQTSATPAPVHEAVHAEPVHEEEHATPAPAPAYQAPAYAAAPAPKAAPAPAAIPTEVPAFISGILAGDRDFIFTTIRRMTQAGHDAEAFMAHAICALDDAYHARIDGTPVHEDVRRVTDHCATPFLERLVTALTTAVDGSYSMGVTGIKLALTRALAVSAG